MQKEEQEKFELLIAAVNKVQEFKNIIVKTNELHLAAPARDLEKRLYQSISDFFNTKEVAAEKCVFDNKRIHDRMQELQEQEDAFNAARKGLKNGCADERNFHGEYYKSFKDYQSKKWNSVMKNFKDDYIWQGIAINVAELIKGKETTETISNYLKTQFEILGK